jgi:hypothetical protein
MQNKLFSLLLLASIAVVPAIAQDKRGASTEEERTKALGYIDDLEKNPIGPDAKEERRWLTIWLIEVPDIHIGVCSNLYPDRPKGDKNDSFIIATQMMFSGARYAIQHPGSPSTDFGQYQAAVEGSLRVYEVLLAQKPKDRQPALDDLLKRREAGTLNDFIKTQLAAHCTK